MNQLGKSCLHTIKGTPRFTFRSKGYTHTHSTSLTFLVVVADLLLSISIPYDASLLVADSSRFKNSTA